MACSSSNIESNDRSDSLDQSWLDGWLVGRLAGRSPGWSGSPKPSPTDSARAIINCTSLPSTPTRAPRRRRRTIRSLYIHTIHVTLLVTSPWLSPLGLSVSLLPHLLTVTPPFSCPLFLFATLYPSLCLDLSHLFSLISLACCHDYRTRRILANQVFARAKTKPCSEDC